MSGATTGSATRSAAANSGFARRVLGGILWRSGSQIGAQLVAWAATFLVIRLLAPSDYGLFAMTQSVLALLGLLAGQSFATALVRRESISEREVRQVFGLLILLNGGVAATQLALAPVVADYYRHPQVADLLRVQVLLYAANPFISLATALLSREMDYRRQALANLASAVAGALAALAGALTGLGVWTLVLAPIALFWTRALMLMAAVRWRIRPSFHLAGAGDSVRFGLAMVTSELLWFVQTQADVFIGGRSLDAHALGLYTTALFLSQILVAKFVPPMNEVAYSAYARLQHDRESVARAFAGSVRAIMLVALPFSVGMALTARPLVEVALGPQWIGVVPIVTTLALAMPLVTVQVLFAPVTNALGAPRLAVHGAIAGALIMPPAFFIGVQGGAVGLAQAWLAAFPLLAIFTAAISLPVIGLSWRRFIDAIATALVPTAGMAAAVLLVASLAPQAPLTRLGLLVGTGIATYAALALLFAREAIVELRGFVKRS